MDVPTLVRPVLDNCIAVNYHCIYATARKDRGLGLLTLRCSLLLLMQRRHFEWVCLLLLGLDLNDNLLLLNISILLAHVLIQRGHTHTFYLVID